MLSNVWLFIVRLNESLTDCPNYVQPLQPAGQESEKRQGAGLSQCRSIRESESQRESITIVHPSALSPTNYCTQQQELVCAQASERKAFGSRLCSVVCPGYPLIRIQNV